MNHFRIKRIYEPAEPDDGFRVLVDRLWPRGISKEQAQVDFWLKEAAPSTALRQWFHTDFSRWEEFKQRYTAELDEHHTALRSMLAAAGDRAITLLYASRETEHNHALVIKECVLTRLPDPEHPGITPLKGNMYIPLEKLNYPFQDKPLLIGGMAMEYYGLRKSGNDIDLVISARDHANLKELWPGHIKDLYGDIGICEFGFEIWNQICRFDYEELKPGAIEEPYILVISLEKLLLLKTLAIRIEKYHDDVLLIVDEIIKRKYA
jgi:uncharacterized protein YeaO (DUF488 family)